MFTRLTEEQVIAAVVNRDMVTIAKFKADIESLEVEVLATLLDTTGVLEKAQLLKAKIAEARSALLIKTASGKSLTQDELEFKDDLEKTMAEANERVSPIEGKFMELNEHLVMIRACKELLAMV